MRERGLYTMQTATKKLSLAGALVSALVLLFTATASAHVVVSPKQVLTSERATFAVSVPNEHDTQVVGVRLIIPEGLTSVRPFAKAGWNVEVVKTGEGEDISATEIKWTSDGGTVPVNLKDDFLFGAKAPESSTELKWKAYETYENGLVVAWEQEPSEEEGSKPYSVTKVVSETDTAASLTKVEAAASDAKTAANRALYAGIAGIVLGLVGVALATRKK